MAMPPGGASGWRKSADIWFLESDGAPFAALRVPTAGHSIAVDVPIGGSPHDWRTILRVAVEASGLVVYGQDSSIGAPWRPGVELLDSAQRQVLPHETIAAPVAGAPPIARWEISPAGAIELWDASDRLRMRLSSSAPPVAAGATRVSGCGGAVVIDLPDHPRTSVRHGESAHP